MQCDAVDLLGDGKLLKKVLQAGHGDVPKLGDRVTVHYVCRLEDETVVDDSRSRGEPMCFALGQGTRKNTQPLTATGLWVSSSVGGDGK
mmetsp:Transcript_1143/g.1991  ORF Transcript_1143/g.1991 Transcript_1143/m.1991 type:complete len:89 (+) Transcript_1143:32-298(+)